MKPTFGSVENPCHTCHGRGWVDDVYGLWFSEDIYNNCPKCKGDGKLCLPQNKSSDKL
jgi:DnaJ-class molecular chaperone